MNQPYRSLAGLLVILSLWLLLIAIAACDDDEAKQERSRQAEAQRQAQLQAQLQTEQAQRQKAEEHARAVEQSRTNWIAGLCAGAGAVCMLVLLVGIHIGSRGLRRTQQEKPHA